MSDYTVFSTDSCDSPRRPAHILVPPPPLKHPGRPDSPGCRTACDVKAPWEETFYQQPPMHHLSSRSLVPPSAAPLAKRLESGTYVAFSIDTEAIAAQTTTDLAHYHIIREYPVRRYAALVRRVDDELENFESFDAERDQDTVVLYLVGTAPPPDGDEMDALPIAPNAGRGAPALETNMLLPWRDAVQWITPGAKLRVSAVHDSTLGFCLRPESLMQFEAAVDTHRDTHVFDNKVFPVQIWRDVRECDNRDNPGQFFAEFANIARLAYQILEDERRTADGGYPSDDDRQSIGSESMVTDSDWTDSDWLSEASGFADDEDSDNPYESMSE